MEEYDVVVIGSGPGGYVAAIRAAQLGLKTACIEKDKVLGGTCLNVGCIPSKALLHSTELLWNLTHSAKEHGIEATNPRLHFDQMMGRKAKVVSSFNDGIDLLFKKNKVARITGEAAFLNPNTVTVAGKEVRGRHFILATGSEPIPLPFLPFDEKKVISSTGALSLERVPKKMLVVGAGVIGVELGSVYSRLGAEVIFIEFLDRICSIMDESLTKEFQRILEAQGMKFHLSSKVTSAQVSEKGVVLQITGPQQTFELSGDIALVSIGRRPYTKNLGLDKAGVAMADRGFVRIDGQFRTSQPHILAIGDIVDGPMLAHKASEEGIAAAEIIAGHKPKVEYAAIPSVVYTHPEVAAVGMTEAEAKNAGFELKIGTFSFKTNSRAKCTGEDEGFVKMIADAKTGRLLGVHILGAHASELIAEACLAIQKRVTAEELAATSHAHPTLSEALKEAALAVDRRAIHK